MPERNAQQIQEVVRDYFAADDRGVAVVYLFGSAARRSDDFRDVDVAILLREEPPPGLDGLCLDMGAELEGRLGVPVDLVVLNRAPVDLVHRVLRDGILLLDRDSSLRIRFEVKARNEYFDLEPVLRRYRMPGREPS